jgi:hypothetical protein
LAPPAPERRVAGAPVPERTGWPQMPVVFTLPNLSTWAAPMMPTQPILYVISHNRHYV